MKKYVFSLLSLIALVCDIPVQAQMADSVFLYRRGSIYSVLVNHTNQKFASEIKDAFLNMPVPDKYNDHDLSVKVLNIDEKLKFGSDKKRQNLLINKETPTTDLHEFDKFLKSNNVASRLVGKWFNRDIYTGECDMNLVQTRGYNNATEREKLLASKTARKENMLRDAGEELIGSTFVLMNDIRYIDKGKGSAAIGTALKILGGVAAIATGNSDYSDAGDSYGDIAASYKGFKVKITTYLYQLVWDDETAGNFYKSQYTAVPDEQKKKAFEEWRGKYTLKYIGSQESDGKNTSFLGINEDEPVMMVRKACQRALDENVANLQKEFDAFKIKSPLISVSPLRSEIGLKEGITPSSRFEVLEAVEDESGHISYEKVGEVKPDKDLIWDNRFMAKEEGAENATLGYTTFKKVSGRNFAAGMLLRQIE